MLRPKTKNPSFHRIERKYHCRYRKSSTSNSRDRLQPDRAFIRVGIDYCGPYDIKAKRLRWSSVCTFLFRCSYVYPLTSELRNFLPNLIDLLDNDTNFVGADRVRLMKSSTTSKEIVSKATERGIKCHSISSRSSHFGGLCGSSIKLLKKHLVRITVV